MASFQETLRRLAIFDEGFATAGSGHHLARASALGPKTAALLQVGVPVAATALRYDIEAALEAPDVLLIALGRPRPDEERFWSFARCERVTVHLPEWTKWIELAFAAR